MSELLTTRDLQGLLKVDRITIYRMLQQGYLPGFKMGGQWRFSRKEIESWLEAQRDLLAFSSAETPGAGATRDAAGLPLHCIQAMQEIFSEAVALATMTMSLDGRPLTAFSRPSEFCTLVRSTARGRQQCALSWKAIVPLAVSDGPALQTCHAGLCYIADAVRVQGRPIAVTVAGQFRFSPPLGEEWMQNCTAVASRCEIPPDELVGASQSIAVHEVESRPRIIHLLQRLVETFSEISYERVTLLARLNKIAEISSVNK